MASHGEIIFVENPRHSSKREKIIGEMRCHLNENLLPTLKTYHPEFFQLNVTVSQTITSVTNDKIRLVSVW